MSGYEYSQLHVLRLDPDFFAHPLEKDATDVPDPFTSGGLNISFDGCVPFDEDSGESVTLATVTQGTAAGGAFSENELPLGDISDSSLEGM